MRILQTAFPGRGECGQAQVPVISDEQEGGVFRADGPGICQLSEQSGRIAAPISRNCE